jgi:deoxycytidylate deaminase
MADPLSTSRVPDPEIVVGLVAAVGTPFEQVQQLLIEAFEPFGYAVEVKHLSRYANRWAEVPRTFSSEAERIDRMMDLGNQARAITGRNDVLALSAVADLRLRRGDERTPMQRRAFVLRQLKHPEEVVLLRRTYGAGFLLIGLYCPLEVRKRHLRERGIAEPDIERLIVRDEREPSESGQQLRDTFHRADVFVEAGDIDASRAGFARLLNLLFARDVITPTRQEFGMFQAYAASLRSAQLGRQVGAALLSDRGDVIALGTNEVPRFGGGSYWEGELPDHRDHVRGRDSNDEARDKIVEEILERTHEGWLQLEPRAREQYCTTFPCHVCAKHIVGAGVREVVYIEPYAKSRASELHDDSIAIEERGDGRVRFRPFVGVAPRRFTELFSMWNEDGSELARKDSAGRVIRGRREPRLGMPYFSGPQREALAAQELESITTGGT